MPRFPLEPNQPAYLPAYLPNYSLSLPTQEHATGLGKVYSDHSATVKSRLKEKSLKLNTLEKVDWRVDYVLGSSAEPETSKPEVHLRLNLRDADTEAVTPLGFSMDAEQCRLLLRELTAAEQIMIKVAPSASGS